MKWLGVLLALTGLTAGPARAYEAPGNRWPGHVIRYHETLPATWDWNLQRAIRVWNTSGARIKFRKVPRAQA